jgi:tetratricopeptide (TPR) repeat protein
MAGVGKSRLVHEALQDVVDRALVVRGRCLPYGEGITYWPVTEAVKDAAGLDETDSPEQSRRKLVALVEGEEDAELVAQRVAEAIGLSEAVAGPEESAWAIRMLFESLARRRPLVVVFDDIHWGEPTFLDLIESIADWTKDAPILLVCLARPELLDGRPGWSGGKMNATSIFLEPLSENESVELVENLAAGLLEESTRARIVDASEGNPLFAEEVLALVLDTGPQTAELRVPPTIHALLTARLDQLGEGERATIEAASTEGKVFHEGSVAELVLDDLRATVHEQLMSLVRKELIRPDRPLFLGEHAYRFRHLLIRDAAYDSVPKAARALLHEHHAAWLERVVGERVSEFEEILGYHLEQAYLYRTELGPVDGPTRGLGRLAAEHLGAAGRRALVRSDAPAAANLISRAVRLLPADDLTRVDLLPTVRVAQGLGDQLGWAAEVLNEAIAAGDERLREHALVQRALLRLFTGSDVAAEELIETAEHAIPVFEELGDDVGLARAWRLVDQANYLARRAGPSVEAAERALAHARRAGDRNEQREIAQFLLVALIFGPAPADVTAKWADRLLAEAGGDPVLEVSALGTRAYAAAIQGQMAAARDTLDRARNVIGELGGGFWVPPIYSAVYAIWDGEAAAAERELRPGFEALSRIGEKSHFSSLAVMLAQAVYAQGRYDEAEAIAAEASAAARPIDVQCQTISRTVRAKVLARRGEADRAEELAREAIGFVEPSDFLPAHAEALMDLAEVLRLLGRPEGAGVALDDAMRLHELKGNVVSAARARRLRDALAGRP